MKTKIYHYRKLGSGSLIRNSEIKREKLGKYISPRGGRTEAVVWDGRVKIVGIAECSNRDNYNKKIGRQIALGRAMKQLRT